MKPELPSRPALLPPPLAAFFDELDLDVAFGPETTAPMRAAAALLEEESFSNHHAAQLMSALGLVASQPRPVRDRFVDFAEILEARGKVRVTIRVTP
jgi:hypothetical protein